MKKAYFFTLDSLIALTLLISILVLIPSAYISEKLEYSSSKLLQQDIINVLSSLQINEVNNSYVAGLISTGEITKNISVLEQIAEFWVKGKKEEAKKLASEMLIAARPEDNIGLWLGGETIFSVNNSAIEKTSDVIVAKELLSGVEIGKAAEGFSAKVFFLRNKKVALANFGGYVGDGNITIQIELENLTSVESAYLEAAINNNFSLYINENFSGFFTKSSNSSMIPEKYNITTKFFRNGTNYIVLKGKNLYIAGGFIKILYKTEEVGYTFPLLYRFPGIDGIINLYDSFYVPAKIESIEAYLHYKSNYKSNYTIYLNIGNTTVFEKNATGEETVKLTNSEFAKLNYSEISFRTVPLRFGLKEIEAIVKQGNADVVLVTDMSGSMNWRLDSENRGIARNCDDPLLYDSSTKRISLAKCLDKDFVNIILNKTGNRIGLSAFYGDASPPYKGRVISHNLDTNKTSLYAQIDSYFTQGGTCICCSINDAYNILQQSNQSRDKYIIVMSDGIPTHHCEAQAGCDGTRTEGLWLGWGSGCYGGAEDCAGTDCLCAMQATNYSSCRANKLNITLHSIGFGPVATCTNANLTLNWIAECGKGGYYASQNATELKKIYEKIAQEIVNISFIEQTALVVGNFSSRLYEDSYISFNYSLPALPFGNLVTAESMEFSEEGNFFVPENVTIAEATIFVYSGAGWAKTAEIKNSDFQNFYNLSNYGENYIKLGDPYAIKIPTSLISKGNNSVRIKIGTSTNDTIPEKTNKIVYTFIVPTISAYSPVLPSAQGCEWQVIFEDESSAKIKIPSNYNGSATCDFFSGKYNENDAIDVATYNLLKKLDFNNNNKIDTKISSEEIIVDATTVKGVPYMWFSFAEARTWK